MTAFEDIELWVAKATFAREKRVDIYEAIAEMLSNGLALQKAIDELYSDASDDGRKPRESVALILNNWRRMLASGGRFGTAIGPWIPPAERMIIEAGDAAGKLPESLEQAIAVADARARMTRALRNQLAYPIMLLAMSIGMIWYASFTLIPQFAEIVPVEKWTGAAETIASIASFIRRFGAAILVALAICSIIFAVSLPRWQGTLRVRFDRYPPWSLYRLWNGAGFLYAAAALARAGVPIQAIPGRLRAHASPWLKERLLAVEHQVNAEGVTNLGTALQRAGHGFPDRTIIRRLKRFGELRDFHARLERIATRYLEQAERRMTEQAKVVNTAAMIAMAIIVGGLFTGLNSIYQQIMTGMS